MALTGKVTQSLRLTGIQKTSAYIKVLPNDTINGENSPFGQFNTGGSVIDCHPDWADEFETTPVGTATVVIISYSGTGSFSYYTIGNYRVGNTIYSSDGNNFGSFNQFLQPGDFSGQEMLSGVSMGAFAGGYVGGVGRFQTPTAAAMAGLSAWFNQPRQQGDRYTLNVTGGPPGAFFQLYQTGKSLSFEATAPAMDIPVGAFVTKLSSRGNLGGFPKNQVFTGSTEPSEHAADWSYTTTTKIGRWPEIVARPHITGYADPNLLVPNQGQFAYVTRLLGASNDYDYSQAGSRGVPLPAPAFNPSNFERIAEWRIENGQDPKPLILRAFVDPPSPKESGQVVTLNASESENIDEFSFEFNDGRLPVVTTSEIQSRALVVPGPYTLTVRGRSFSGPLFGSHGKTLASGSASFYAGPTGPDRATLPFILVADFDFARGTAFPADKDGFVLPAGVAAQVGIDQELYAGSLMRLQLIVPGHYSGEFIWRTGASSGAVLEEVETASYVPRYRSPSNTYPYYVTVEVGQARGPSTYAPVTPLTLDPGAVVSPGSGLVIGLLLYAPRKGEAAPVVIPYEIKEPFATPLSAPYVRSYDLNGRKDDLRVEYGTPR